MKAWAEAPSWIPDSARARRRKRREGWGGWGVTEGDGDLGGVGDLEAGEGGEAELGVDAEDAGDEDGAAVPDVDAPALHRRQATHVVPVPRVVGNRDVALQPRPKAALIVEEELPWMPLLS